jgi:solute carrier family 25 2-oxodicarboxylate transporter 21
VVKSRIQGAAKVPGVVPKYNWTYPAYVLSYLISPSFLRSPDIFSSSLVTIYREEGARALYKGFLPKVLRLAPGGGVLLLVVEVTLNIFRKGGLIPDYGSSRWLTG